MNITTKELFELAEIFSDEWDRQMSDLDDSSPWAELSPIDQAGMAEGVRAVIEELQRRGWEPPKFNNGGWIIPAEFHFPKPYWPLNTGPRVWQRIEDVPTDVAVTDADGDRWEYRDGEWGIVDGFGDFDGCWDDLNWYTPFTEIIEEKPATDALADWEKELINPDGPWDRWEDVPDNIMYTSSKDSDGPSWINRNGVRFWVSKARDWESRSVQHDIAEHGPFVSVAE